MKRKFIVLCVYNCFVQFVEIVDMYSVFVCDFVIIEYFWMCWKLVTDLLLTNMKVHAYNHNATTSNTGM